MQKFDETTHNLPLKPQCFSTRSTLHPLAPIESHGWSLWSPVETPDKTYLMADQPGATVVVEIETRLGDIKMYSLRSRHFGLGSVECWVGTRRKDAVRVDGWWDQGHL